MAFATGAIIDRLTRLSGPAAPAQRTSYDFWDHIGRLALVAAAIAFFLFIARGTLEPPADPASQLIDNFPRIMWLCLAGAALSLLQPSRGWVVLGCGIAAGLMAWTASSLVGSGSLTEQAVHYEVPKSVGYWLPVMLAIGAAGAMAAFWRLRWLGIARPLALLGLLIIIIYPWPSPLISNIQIGEHRGSESVGLALREAELGYWNGYPDARLIIDGSAQEVVDFLRAEQAAGRLRSTTRVLHLASTFQQWGSVPIGVFTGAIETSISLQPELSIHTDGGRLYGFDQLDVELAEGYGYVVVEPDRLPASLLDTATTQVESAGYHVVWQNARAIVYARA
jgi:hypothetical protein